MNLPNHVTLQKASVYTSRPEGGGLGRSPKTEGAIGRKAHLTAGDGASLRLSYFLPRFHEAARKIGVGYRQPPASTIPSANRNCTAHLLPQSPAVTAPSRRELWGLYLATLACCLWESARCRIPQAKIKDFCQLPLAREPRAVPADNAHGGFLRIVTSLTRPVSAACRRTFSLFTLHYSLKLPGNAIG